ncbi:MAG: PTS system mannose/fructose/sorbose family transporter subunit IID [bacterium]|nr:PTS system mannose/fructose/sorbose family transporter subunit IID [bacterium]MCP4799428.1 PTS system mannose/fructose/sorbose family transporter subunit IID [bacterium]
MLKNKTLDIIRKRLFFRSLALQASWTSRRMQSLGLIYALYPWLESSNLQLKEKVIFCRRHLAYFNTNPYYANFLIGGLIRLEDDSCDNPGQLISSYKESLGRALASLGDQFFWLGLRPALLSLSIVAGLCCGPQAALLPVLFFAIAQLILRWKSLNIGFELGLDIADLMANSVWHKSIGIAKHIATLLAGILTGLVVVWVYQNSDTTGTLSNVYVMVTGVISFVIFKRKMPVEGIVLTMLPVLAVLSYL